MKKTKPIDLYLILLGFATLIAGGLRVYALLNSFNSITMQYESSLAITIANIIVTVSVLLFGANLIFGDKKQDLIAKTNNAASFIPAGIVSVALLFMGVSLFNSASEMFGDTLRYLSMASAVFAFLSVGSFFISVFIEKNNSHYKSIFILCTVIFLAIYSCYLFFNKQVHPTNSPNKITDQMAYLFAAVFFLYEARIQIGRAKWRGYIAFGFIAALICAFSSIPSLVVYAINGYIVSNSLIESVLTLALAIFITSKVWQTKKLTPNEECDEAKSIEALATARSIEIEEQRKLARAHVSNINEENEEVDDASNYTFDIPYVETSTEFNGSASGEDLHKNYTE